jgi:hypothetical protein
MIPQNKKVCHWGTVNNYLNRFCSDLPKSSPPVDPKDCSYLKGEKGWELLEKMHIIGVENCGMYVVEYDNVHEEAEGKDGEGPEGKEERDLEKKESGVEPKAAL